MAWHHPHHICGHEGERIQLYGPSASREKKLRAIESRECMACRLRRIAKSAEEAGLPSLRGSDRQIAWAADIRARALVNMPAEAAARARTESEAAWWIKNFRRS
jgi:hypothetical protein